MVELGTKSKPHELPEGCAAMARDLMRVLHNGYAYYEGFVIEREGSPPKSERFGAAHLFSWMGKHYGKRNCYLSAAQINPGISRKDKYSKEDIVCTTALWVDCDPDGKRFEESRAEILAALTSYALPPSCIVDSGNGFQAWWFLQQEESDRNAVERRNEHLSNVFAGGDKCWSIDHIMRSSGNGDASISVAVSKASWWLESNYHRSMRCEPSSRSSSARSIGLRRRIGRHRMKACRSSARRVWTGTWGLCSDGRRQCSVENASCPTAMRTVFGVLGVLGLKSTPRDRPEEKGGAAVLVHILSFFKRDRAHRAQREQVTIVQEVTPCSVPFGTSTAEHTVPRATRITTAITGYPDPAGWHRRHTLRRSYGLGDTAEATGRRTGAAACD